MISHHWFRWSMSWCYQATSHCLSQCWHRVCYHIVSLGHNELTHIVLIKFAKIKEIFAYSILSQHWHATVQSSCIIARFNLSLWWQKQYSTQTWNSQQIPHTSPSRASYGVSIVRILGENWPRYNGTTLYFALYNVHVFCFQHRRVNTLRPRQNGRHFTDDIFKCMFLNENFRILNEISLKYVP